MNIGKGALVRAHVRAHPFTVCLAAAAILSAIVLVLDEQAFAAISILQVTTPAMGVAWLIAAAAGGLLTLCGLLLLRGDVEALGVMLLAGALAVQGVGTLARFGLRSTFPVMVFFGCALACFSRVLTYVRARPR